MISNLSVLVCFAGISVGCLPNDDEALRQQLSAFLQRCETWMQDGDYYDKSARESFIDENLGDIKLDHLSPRELRSLIWFTKDTAHFESAARRLQDFAETSGVEGAIAQSVLALQSLYTYHPRQVQNDRMLAAYTHPAFAEALKTSIPAPGRPRFDPLWSLLVQAPWLWDQSLPALEPALLRMTRELCDTNDAAYLPHVRDIAMRLMALRTRLSESILKEASTEIIEYVDAISTESAAEAKEAGRIREFARAMAVPHLTGRPTPEVDIIWDSEQRDWRHLEDLRGNVVLIDFWATSCAPCIAEFPEIRELRDHYRGFNVVILGVTGLQGYVIDPDEGLIDCRDDPEREIELTEEVIRKLDVNWPMAITKQPSVNRDFGFVAIPYKVLIDPEGVVRAVDLESELVLIDGRTEVVFTQVMNGIDALLEKAGLPVPAASDRPK